MKLKQELKRIILKNKKYNSQIGQDKWVLYKTNNKRNGFFIEVGAGDGLYLSNTYALEKRGWKGICIEPANKIEQLKRNRRCIIDTSCLSNKSGQLVEFQIDNEISGIKNLFDKRHERKGKIIKLRTSTIKEVLEKYNVPKNIDYLSIDTEGSEYEILKEFPFDKYKVHLITVEHNANSKNKKDIKKQDDIFWLLYSKGFIRQDAERYGYALKYDKNGGDFEDWYENFNCIN